MRRKYLLEIIANAFKWLVHSFTYLYNSLVPTTIDGKSVKDKARIKKIYANGVIENQLCSILTNDFAQDNLTITYDATIKGFIVNGTANADSYVIISDTTQTIVNHKYLVFGCSGGGANTYHIYLSGNNNDLDTGNGIIFNVSTAGTRAIIFRYKNGVSFNNIKIIPQLIDLTQMFGTGNEPTTLTDNRIQKIINGGYIEFNAGSYKGTDISEFSSKSANIFDQQLEQGGISSAGGVETTVPFRCRNVGYLPIDNTKPLWLNCVSDTYQYALIAFYDSSQNYISYLDLYNKTLPYQVSVPSNAKYIRFGVRRIDNNNCSPSDFANTNFYVGYVSGNTVYKSFSPLSFIYQGNGALNSHDTMEIASSEYVFTKNVSSVDLGTLNFTQSGSRYYTNDLSSIIYRNVNSANQNSLSTNYQVVVYNSSANTSNSISENSGYVWVNTTTTPTGIFTFTLATPQVIRIPRKHLGIVDLGSLNWNYDENNARFFVDFHYIKKNTTNMYCEKYLYHAVNSSMSDKQIGCVYVGGNDRIYIKDYLYTTATDFKNAMIGVYLFYETEDEVVDIPFTLDIEAGGTITSDSDVLPNVDFDIKCK